MSIKSHVISRAIAKIETDYPPGFLEFMAEYTGASAPTTEAIATATLPLEFVRLRDSGDFYQEECYRAAKNGAYLSACIMAAAAIESLLLMVAYLNEDEVLATSTFSRRKHQIGKPAVTQLGFAELIQLSSEFCWVPNRLIEKEWTDFLANNRELLTRLSQVDSHKPRKLPEDPGQALLRFLQGIRNCIHGGRFVQSGLSPDRQNIDRACRIAVRAYEELKETLLVTMMRDSKKMKRIRLQPS